MHVWRRRIEQEANVSVSGVHTLVLAWGAAFMERPCSEVASLLPAVRAQARAAAVCASI